MATRNSPQPRPGTPIENRNFLSPVGFKFGLKRSPAVAFFCNEANIPDMTLGITEQPTYLRDIPTPGDKIQFGDLNLRFLVDEDLTNYMEIQNWIRGLGFPESLKEFAKLARGKSLFRKNRSKISKFREKSQNLISSFSIAPAPGPTWSFGMAICSTLDLLVGLPELIEDFKCLSSFSQP